jgi:hydroxymethylbilane synthase
VNANEIAIGSRGSALALAQARLLAEAFERVDQPSRIVVIQTEGDRRAPDTAWGEGTFVAAIERALLDRRIDVAAHSAKDMPTDEDERLRIGAYLARADPRDALVISDDAKRRTLDELAPGSRVGTDSPRRTGFLLARRPDLVLHPIPGNVDTRLHRLDDGETDALVLACAGLDRLGIGSRIAEHLAPEIVPPAPGQGAVAVQIRRDDVRMVALAATIDHQPTRTAVESERAFLAASGGGCRAPIGALATLEDGELVLLGAYASVDGSATAIARFRGPSEDGKRLADELARELGSRLRTHTVSTKSANEGTGTYPRVIVTRATEQTDQLSSALQEAGLEPVPVATIAVELDPPGGELDAAATLLDTFAWVVVTSANGARAIVDATERTSTERVRPSWAAIGPATRRVLEQAGIEIHFLPSRSSASTMAVELPIASGDRVLVVRGDLGDAGLVAGLRARGAEVHDVVGYRTREAPSSSRALLRQARAGGAISAVVFTSGSTVRGFVALGRHESIDVLAIPSVCIGPETADEARSAGFRVLAVSPSPDATDLATTTASALALQPEEIS